MGTDELPEPVGIPVVWGGVDDSAPLFVNQFVFQVHEEDVWFVAGVVQPPLALGKTQEERVESIKSVQFVPIRTVARLALNRQRLLELKSAVDDAVAMVARLESSREEARDQ